MNKILEIRDGIQYSFNHEIFNIEYLKHFRQEKEKSHISEENYRERIADRIGISASSIKSWRNGYNGPGDISYVKDIANYWGIEYSCLLKERSAEKMEVIDETKKEKREIIKRVYSLFADYIELFEKEKGFVECKEKFVEVEEDEFMDESANAVFDQEGEVHFIVKQFNVIDDERNLHSKLRKEIQLSRFDLPEEFVDKMLAFLYQIGPDPIINSFDALPKDFDKFMGMPCDYYYYMEEQTAKLYQQLNLIFEQYFV